LLTHGAPQTIERLPHVHGLDRHVDPNRCWEREHQLRSAFTNATTSATRPPRTTAPSGNRTSSSFEPAACLGSAEGNCTCAKAISPRVAAGSFGRSRCNQPASVL